MSILHIDPGIVPVKSVLPNDNGGRVVVIRDIVATYVDWKGRVVLLLKRVVSGRNISERIFAGGGRDGRGNDDSVLVDESEDCTHQRFVVLHHITRNLSKKPLIDEIILVEGIIGDNGDTDEVHKTGKDHANDDEEEEGCHWFIHSVNCYLTTVDVLQRELHRNEYAYRSMSNVLMAGFTNLRYVIREAELYVRSTLINFERSFFRISDSM